MVVAVSSIVCTIAGIAFVVYLIRLARQGDPDRRAEDAAREHFARYGRWPDE